jgi:hypothetical protein
MAAPLPPPKPGRNQPPPVKEKKTRHTLNIERLVADKEALEENRQAAEGLLFFDWQSEAVRKRRENHRQAWERFMKAMLEKDNPTNEEMYNMDNVIEFTNRFLLGIAKYAKGNIGDKPKAGVLFQMKDSLYWWFIRFMPTFVSIFGLWHHEAVGAIHRAALMFNFETGWREKKDLTTAELQLFWQHIQTLKIGRQNWHQHFIAWLLTLVTSARPGSYTVCPGYEKGSRIAKGFFRTEDETLRWSDCVFTRHEDSEGGGISVTITFRYLKGFRVSHQQKQLSGIRVFRILPLSNNQYHIDLALHILALAFSRGLFPFQSVEELFASRLRTVPQVPEVSRLPVFVKSNQAGELSSEPMHESALNPKLREMCTMVGLLARNSMYSWRRGAIVDSRRKQGTEMSSELANHVQGGKSIYSYDSGLGDVDFSNIRMGLEGKDRESIRKMFDQASTGIVPLDDDIFAGADIPRRNSLSMKDNIAHSAKVSAQEDEEYVEFDDQVRQSFNEGRAVVTAFGVDPDLMAYNQDVRDQLNERADTDPDCQAALVAIDAAIQERADAFRRLKLRYVKEIKAKLILEAAKNQKIADSANRTGTRGRFSEAELAAKRSVRSSAPNYLAEVEAVDATDAANAENEDEDEDAEEELDHTRMAPDSWKDLIESEAIVVAFQQGEDPLYTNAGRINAVKQFIHTESHDLLQRSGLLCPDCLLDDTIPIDKQNHTYTVAKLHEHLRSVIHSRRSQILRAFNLAKGDLDPKYPNYAKCPVCKEDFRVETFIKHVTAEHPAQMAL